MELLVERKIYSKKSTIGELSINGEHICFTLEDTVRPKGVKVYGETAIPAGNYSIKFTKSNRFKKILPLIFNTKQGTVEKDGVKFDGVRIHTGNYPKDTHGCLLVGKSRDVDFIGKSKIAFDELMERIQGFQDISLEIVDTKDFVNQEITNETVKRSVGIVKATKLNVRMGPGKAYDTFENKLLKGNQVEILNTNEDWLKIIFNAEVWVSLSYVSKDSFITADKLNMRIGPSTNYEKLGDQLKFGLKVDLLEKKDGWGKIKFETTGWVYSAYII